MRRVPGIAALLAVPAVTAAQEPIQRTFELETLAPGVVAALVVPEPPHYAFANSLVVDLGEGLLVVDTQQSTAAARDLIAEIRRRWDAPVRWVVNTHPHSDHHYGNSAYREVWPDVVFIGHPATREELLGAARDRVAEEIRELDASIAERRQWLESGTTPDGTPLTAQQRGRIERSLRLRSAQLQEQHVRVLVPPRLLVTDTLRIDAGHRSVRVIAVGPAHTSGDLIVWLPDDRILAAGDLVEDGLPWIEGGHIDGWTRALDRVLDLEPRVVLPAHGAPRRTLREIELQRDAFAAAVRAACHPAETTSPAHPAATEFARAAGMDDARLERFWTALVQEARRTAPAACQRQDG